MKKGLFFIVLCMMVCLWQPIAGAVSITAEVNADIQMGKDYNMDILNMNLPLELESQTYLVAGKIGLGENLLITPKIGIFNSNLEIADLVKVDNEIGLAVGIDAEYKIYTIVDRFPVSLIGGYSFKHTEADSLELIPLNLSIDNPLRNDIGINSWETGVKVAFPTPPVNLVPYVAAVYSDSNIDIDANLAIVDLNLDATAEDNFGLRAGVEGTPLPNWKVKVEGRFIDDKAIVASISRSF